MRHCPNRICTMLRRLRVIKTIFRNSNVHVLLDALTLVTNITITMSIRFFLFGFFSCIRCPCHNVERECFYHCKKIFQHFFYRYILVVVVSFKEIYKKNTWLIAMAIDLIYSRRHWVARKNRKEVKTRQDIESWWRKWLDKGMECKR